jgi:trehalose 6-phosphate phosphatase
VKDLLAKVHADVVRQLAWSRVLCAFDFDGTLSPIVADRDQAGMRETTCSLLGKLAALYPTAVISGRSQRDVKARLRGLGIQYVVGNHGLEPGTGLQRYEAQVAATVPLLVERLVATPGIDVEDKQYSLAIHYRRARNKTSARRAISQAVASLPDAYRLIAGKQVVNLVPSGAAHKGDAVIDLRDRAGADVALYVGDDVTDEDVFTLDQPGRLLSVRIGKTKSSAASYFLRDQRQIDRLLRTLVSLRERAAR